MKYEIPNPCPEDWNKMKIGINSRHCDTCSKSVVDFTKRTREEILAYLLMHNQDNVCGHIRRSQLDFTPNDIMIVINGMTPKEKKSNLAFYVLCAGAMMLASCNQGSNSTAIQGSTIGEIVEVADTGQIDSTETCNTTTDTTSNDVIEVPPPPVEPGIEPIITGEVIEGKIAIEPPVDPGDTIEWVKQEQEVVLQFAEVMPEFPGGTDALFKFIQKNLSYPQSGKEFGQEGTVIARFIVGKDSSLRDFRIVRSIHNNKDFDDAVLKVLRKMPPWTPGKQNGKLVDVQMHLPVRFKLD